ncbi:MAG TPA: hypothetical protein PLL28_04570 [Chitinophagales bacterium]|nr:hypothetical protein [Chitinophagales bacterium]HMZ88922.1 hypothetical protein [Chitinophagales bacterium]HNA57756.1 hypothetical protein [Chitinophagales bacterium]HNE46183.1 hypothetical protein [Chitinophagales bacterium]HNF68626.1 hypothetical protein [Chitinophagales bacterium]
MILIADSGSSKTDWALLHPVNGDVLPLTTKGLNPIVLPVDALISIMSANEHLLECATDVSAVYFYGAGCTGDVSIGNMHAALASIFKSAKIAVFSDMTGAVHAVADNKPCIVSILGTGANSCLFNGKSISGNDFSLGYVLGDEGSGTWFGKRLIRDHWYCWMPESIAAEFEKQYALTREEILKQTYRSPAPNAWLASFAPFIVQHRQHEYMQEVIFEGLTDFFDAYINRFENSNALPLHFIGSLSCALEPEIRNVAEENALSCGKFIQSPISGLIQFYQSSH